MDRREVDHEKKPRRHEDREGREEEETIEFFFVIFVSLRDFVVDVRLCRSV